jgi:heme exporter protein B
MNQPGVAAPPVDAVPDLPPRAGRDAVPVATLPMARRVPGTLRAAWIIAGKDLVVEIRTHAAFLSAAVFTVLAAAIFLYTWDPAAVPALDLAPGVIWVIFTFSGLLGLNRSFGAELADRAIDGLLAAPINREAIYLGKALANLVFVLAVQLVAVPAVVLFYNLSITGAGVAALTGITMLAAIGLVAVGTLFSAMAVNTRLAELLLPVLALPFLVPVVTAAAQATVLVLNGRSAASVWEWEKLLIGFDLVFVTACTLAYPFTIER